MVGSDGWPSFVVGIAGFVLCALILFLTTGRLAAFEEEAAEQGRGIGRFWRLAPALLLAVVISSVKMLPLGVPGLRRETSLPVDCR